MIALSGYDGHIAVQNLVQHNSSMHSSTGRVVFRAHDVHEERNGSKNLYQINDLGFFDVENIRSSLLYSCDSQGTLNVWDLKERHLTQQISLRHG